jgi:hypothetical protein
MKKLSYLELYKESIAHLTSQNILVRCGLGFGSSLHHTDEKRPKGRDVDFRFITESNMTGIEFKASDGTICDLSFTTLKDAEKQHEVLIAMLLGSPWLDASGNRTEPMTLPPTLKESLQLLLPSVGTTIHHNCLKGKDDHVKTFQSVKLMVALMQMVIGHQDYPHYNPYAFFPEGFNKDAFVEFLRTSKVDCTMVVDLFTKAQYRVDKSDIVKAQEPTYAYTIEALPKPLKELMAAFKAVTKATFPNPRDKKGVSGVRTVLDYISQL